MTDQQRQFTRVPYHAEATLIVGGQTYPSIPIENISTGGCLLTHSLADESQTRCEVIIRLAGADISVRVQGAICRHSPTQVAVAFDTISDEGLTHLRRIIEYNATDPDAVEDEFLTNPSWRSEPKT